LASLLGIIFQSSSENKSTSMYSIFYSPSPSKTYISFCLAWFQMPKSFTSVRKQQEGATFPYSKIHRKPASFPYPKNKNSHYTFYIREICTILSTLAICYVPSRKHWSVYEAHS
jgi:hypothetical protein